MESITTIRQMMAEQKFSDVQLLIEVQLSLNSYDRHELLLLYYDSLAGQDKSTPELVLMELAQFELKKKNYSFVMKLLENVKNDIFYMKKSYIKFDIYKDTGQIEDLYKSISDFYINLYEKKIPIIPNLVSELQQTYFKNDFLLKLNQLAIILLQSDLDMAELILGNLIVEIVEKPSHKGINNKLSAIEQVLKSSEEKLHIEIYQNFCNIFINGINRNTDYKKIIEMIIYFDDFKLMVIVLNLMEYLGLTDEVKLYSSSIREHVDYSYVYLDKYFTHLKKYFFQAQSEKSTIDEEYVSPDYSLSENFKPFKMIQEVKMFSKVDEIESYLNVLKHQKFSSEQLCDLAVSFLQSEMPHVALKASILAVENAINEIDTLKAYYLKLTALLQIGDYRAAVDTSLEALNITKSHDDILSFLYGQAEAYIQLKDFDSAKINFRKILSIDPEYRLVKDRLDQL